MKHLLLILITIVGFSPTTIAEPKFRYIDSENKDKPKDESAKKPPQKPAYYDEYKKQMAPAQTPKPNPSASDSAANPQVPSEEDIKKMDEYNKVLQESGKDLPRPTDYANPPKAKKPE
ncbi:MAG: hypothetical protein SGJ18_03160 [Pseudomonadota bacterium]|nr:hypothetical protein [Pseudomonadota bacterium]